LGNGAVRRYGERKSRLIAVARGRGDPRRSFKAFAITETELNVIAALAIIGLNKMPNQG
jgi:hypothetical protein